MSVKVGTSKLMNVAVWDSMIFLDGWTPGKAGTANVTDKATGEIIGRVGVASPEDVNAACEAAAKAAPGWAATSPEKRAEIVRKAGELLRLYTTEAVEWLVRESGSTKYKAAFEVQASVAHFDNSADFAIRVGRTVVTDTPALLSYYDRVPLGVVGIIGPFNFPLVLDARSLTAALAMGNAVVLKPSLNTAVSGGLLLARIFEEAGLPKGVLHVLPGEGDTGTALTQHPLVQMIAFTGSTAVGRKIGATAGAALKRMSLELGGKNPFIVLNDADLELAARAGAFGSFLHQGQICMSIGIHVVHESIVEAYSDRIAALAREMKVGNPWVEEVALGPIINEKQRDNILRVIQDTISAGATLVEGGTYEGLFVRPTVLKNVPQSSVAFHEEIFGPVAIIVPFKTDEEAVAIANATEYGLTAGVFGTPSHATSIANKIEAGMIHINDQTVLEDARIPFGGVKSSGNPTRIGGESDLEEYTTFRWTTETREPKPYSLPNV